MIHKAMLEHPWYLGFNILFIIGFWLFAFSNPLHMFFFFMIYVMIFAIVYGEYTYDQRKVINFILFFAMVSISLIFVKEIFTYKESEVVHKYNFKNFIYEVNSGESDESVPSIIIYETKNNKITKTLEIPIKYVDKITNSKEVNITKVTRYSTFIQEGKDEYYVGNYEK
jgi:hypothetical protein